MRQCMRTAPVVQEGWAVWQEHSGEGPACSVHLIKQNMDSKCTCHCKNKISRYVYPCTSSVPKPQAAEFPQFCFKPQLPQKPVRILYVKRTRQFNS